MSRVLLSILLGFSTTAIISTGLAIPSSAQAQEAQEGSRRYQIDAGSLGSVLNQFALSANIQISSASHLTAGRQSPGLHGTHTVESGLQALLQGTGLEAVPQGGAQYSLRLLPRSEEHSSDVRTLEGIVVSAMSAADESATNYTVSRSRSASKLDLELKETPQSISVFTEKMVADLAITNISEVMEFTPGITVLENGVPGAGRVQYYARGFAINNFQLDGVMLDGAVFGAQNNAANRTTVGMQDPFMYERMDIVRGSTGLTTGSGDPAASLSFTRKRPLPELQIQANLKYSSWNNKRAEIDISTPMNESGSWRTRIAGTKQQGDSYQDRVSHRGEAWYGITELDITPTTMVSLGFSHLTRKVDGAGPHGTQRMTAYRTWNEETQQYQQAVSSSNLDRSFNSATQWSYRDFSWRNYFVNLEHTFDNGWRVAGTYNRFLSASDRFYGVMGSQFYLPEYGIASYSVGREKYDNTASAYDLYLSGDFELLGRSHDFVVGMNQVKTTYLNYGFPPQVSSSYIPYVDGPRRDVDAFNYYYRNQWISTDTWDDGNVALPYITQQQVDFGFTDWDTPRVGAHTKNYQRGVYFTARLRPTERLQTILGARYGRGTNIYHAPHSFIPYAGLIYEITPSTNVFASYTRIEKPQTPSDGRPVGKDGKFLDPIKGNSTEFGVKSGLFDNTLNLSLSYFTMTQNNVGVESQDGTLVEDPDYPGSQFPAYIGIDGYRVYGLDLGFAGQITPEWSISGGYIYQRQNVPDLLLERSADAEEFEESFFFPRHSFKLFTTYQLSPRWTLGGGITWQSGSKTSTPVYNAEGKFQDYQYQGSYALVNLLARYQASKHVTLGINVNNVFDKWYFTNSNIANYGAPRNIIGSVSMTF